MGPSPILGVVINRCPLIGAILPPRRKVAIVPRNSSICNIMSISNCLSYQSGFESARLYISRNIGIAQGEIGKDVITDPRNLPVITINLIVCIAARMRASMSGRFQVALVVPALDQAPIRTHINLGVARYDRDGKVNMCSG